MDENPNIKIVHNKAAISQDARTNYFAKLGKEGLADIEAVEVDWFTEAMQYSDLLAEVPDSAKGRWVDWKEAAATDPDGRLVGFGTDIGPQAICYRADLFEAAGLPTDPDEVAALFDGDWNNYFDVADQYKAATGKPMIDSAASVFQGMINQIEFPYDEPDGTVVATDNPELEDAYNLIVERAVPNAAYSAQWTDDWNASMANGEFASMLCPPWMLGIIEGNAPDVTGWEVANAFPNGGGNWGGSYLTVPANGKNVEAALALADWLTSAATQEKTFVNAGQYPSVIEAQSDPAITDSTNAYFNDAPTGTDLRRAFRRRSRSTPTRASTSSSTTRRCRTRSPASSTAPKTSRPRGTPTWPRSKRSDRLNSSGGRASPRGPHFLLTRSDPGSSAFRSGSDHRTALLPRAAHPARIADTEPHVTATDTRSTASPDSSAEKPERTPRHIMSFSDKLSRWDLKVSPYLYISPFFILFVIVGLFPIAYTAVISFQEWDLVRNTGKFVGFEQYIWILTQEQFWVALRNTFSIFLLSSVPQIILALFIAAMLDRNIRAKTFWRMSVLLPFVMAPVAVALIFSNLFGDNHGLVNTVLTNIGIARDPAGTKTRSGATSRSRRWSTSAGPATTPSSSSPRCRRFRATTTKRPPSTAPARSASSGASRSRRCGRPSSSSSSPRPSAACRSSTSRACTTRTATAARLSSG